MGDFSDLEIMLPYTNNIESTIQSVINSLSCNSILFLDSLNGLVDCLNISNLYKMGNKRTSGKKTMRFKSAGYQSFNILSLLLKKVENKKIPIILTIYQSIEKSKKMVNEWLLDGNLESKNHFVRISNAVLFLEFSENDGRTGFTIIKKKSSLSPSSANHASPLQDVFIPYSKWLCCSFVKP
jgi:midasin (ATPase involved in ribosome maturation)